MTRRSGLGSASGFTLVELLVASALVLVAVAAAGGVAVAVQDVWRAGGAQVDLQQRARIAADVLGRALTASGAGPGGGGARGPLLRVMPPVIPRRIGRRAPDPPASVRLDAFSVIAVSPDGEPAVLLLDVPAGAADIEIAPAAACDLPACGFRSGTAALIVDGAGAYDVFTVTAVTGSILSLRHHGGGSATGYPAGSPVLLAEVATYYLDAGTRTLRRSDGDDSDVPLVDEVADLRVEYFGTPSPPRRPQPPPGLANCLYAADGTYHAALMAGLPSAGGSESVLDPGSFADGPWCGAGANRYDADVLRIRRVRLTVRLQAPDAAVRGLDPARFRTAGSAARSAGLVPDVSVVVDVTPPNLRGGW